METNEQRPNAALINREWFESAVSVLEREQLAHLCLYAVEYVLYGRDTVQRACPLGIVFSMIKPALDSDIIKYRERCARNSANAKSQRQRVAASGSEWERVEANTTTTSTTTPTTTTTTTTSISPEKAEEIEKWLIYGYFWSSGSKAINEECSAFWSYYESLGWKNNKGAAIVSKLAAARMWRRQFETGGAPNGADAWFKALQRCTIPDYNVFRVFKGAERNEGGAIVRLGCKRSFYEGLTAAVPDLLTTLRRLWGVPEVTIETLPD